ncbi:tetratricopeptide repeat protein [Variovorax paradoxus]|nr:tetratricopeptide repeat protein [Variovorax paradoxus]
MTIGRPQGAVWIGKPLDVVIPLSLDSAEDAGALCLEAEVVQGDTRMADRSLTVSLQPGPNPSSPRMHIRSSVAVDEPVVNVSVQAGCNTKSTRSYVLLSDVQAEPTLPVMASPSGPRASSETAVRAPARVPSRAATAGASSGLESPAAASARRSTAAAAPAARTRDADAQSPRRSAASPPVPRRSAAAQPVATPRAAVPRAAPAATAAEPRRESVAGGPRLQLDALEPVPAAQPGLKATQQLSLPASEDLARRAAAAAEWRALNTEPEAAQREAQRMQALEATLAALREQTAQNQRTLLEMRSELAQARDSRYRNPLVYALMALLLIALVAILLLWRLARRAAAPAWWGEAPLRGDGCPTRPSSMHGLLEDEPDTDSSPPRRSANATTFGAATFGALEPDDDSGYGEPESRPVRTPDGAPVRPVNTEELFDVQQQSDFFLSLGQHDQAIAVLREHIATNPGTSALAYLDLLRIFHSLGRKEDYARLAEEFEQAFNADVPAFENFTETGRGLEHYRSTLARIESQWPAPGTLALIEELVFRKPGAHGDEAFDLAAYQELLLLYSVAKEVIDPNSAPPAPVTPHSFVDTFGHDQLATTPAPLERESPPEPVDAGLTLPPSIYGAIDDDLHHETVLVPDAAPPAPSAMDPAATRAKSGIDMDLAEFDKTAFETMRAPIETPKPAPAPANDPHVIDFELFDPATEAEIAPRPTKPFKR